MENGLEKNRIQEISGEITEPTNTLINVEVLNLIQFLEERIKALDNYYRIMKTKPLSMEYAGTEWNNEIVNILTACKEFTNELSKFSMKIKDILEFKSELPS